MPLSAHIAFLEARVITLDPAGKYYTRISKALEASGIPHLPSPGVKWLELPEEDPRKGMIKFKHGPTYTYGAAGSFLAHVEVWKEASHRKGLTLIFEDDALLDTDRLLNRLRDLPDLYDVLLLSPERGPETGIFSLPSGDMRFNSTAGYLVTPTGAMKLLNCICNLEPEGAGWKCVDRVSWQLPIHLEKARDRGASVLCDGTRPVSHDSKESLTRYITAP